MVPFIVPANRIQRLTCININLRCLFGNAIALRQSSLTVMNHVWSCIRWSRICSAQNGTWAGFLWVLWFPLPILILPVFHTGAGELSLTPPHKLKTILFIWLVFMWFYLVPISECWESTLIRTLSASNQSFSIHHSSLYIHILYFMDLNLGGNEGQMWDNSSHKHTSMVQ
jgi:hypothetical protein